MFFCEIIEVKWGHRAVILIWKDSDLALKGADMHLMPWHTLSRGHVSTCTVCKPDGSSHLRPPQPRLTQTVWAMQREQYWAIPKALGFQPPLGKPHWAPNSELPSRFPPEILVHQNRKWNGCVPLWPFWLKCYASVDAWNVYWAHTCIKKELWNTVSHFSIQVLTLLSTRDLMNSGMARVVCLWIIGSHFYSLNLSRKTH